MSTLWTDSNYSGPILLALSGDFEQDTVPRVALDPADPEAALAPWKDGGWEIRGETRLR